MKDFSIMGVLNVTPDSFSDGGAFDQKDKALAQANQMILEGADIIDIGGESTRPGAAVVAVKEELSRVIPVIQGLKQQHPQQLISIDTQKPVVMQQAVASGAGLINDVNALQAEDALAVAADLQVPVCLMHMQGIPENMQDDPDYDDVVQVVLDFFQFRVDACLDAGIKEEHIILDPGIGFGKTLKHNIQLLQNIDVFKHMGFPVLVGVSRKSMIGQILDKPVDERLYGSLAAAQFAYLRGADIFRVHDVTATRDVLQTCAALVAE
ncbi:dihydropteroate synthase [Marinicella sp. W31]|uniref:dihydropteroate synthase n=1 Tax=Marinicella sp. W31 TaxID=3023713 RepID=UPI00375827F5